MFKVITMINKEVVKKVTFDEKTDDDAMKKALVECDRAVWSRDLESSDDFLVALMQDNRLLRFMNDKGWQVPRTSIYD
jgi:hypothetical protein